MFWSGYVKEDKVNKFMNLPFNLALVALALLSGAHYVARAQALPPSMIESEPGPGSGDASPPVFGTVSGTIVDQSGAVVAGAQVSLRENSSLHNKSKQTVSRPDGHFSFSDITPGPFQLTSCRLASPLNHSLEHCILAKSMRFPPSRWSLLRP